MVIPPVRDESPRSQAISFWVEFAPCKKADESDRIRTVNEPGLLSPGNVVRPASRGRRHPVSRHLVKQPAGPARLREATPVRRGRQSPGGSGLAPGRSQAGFRAR